MRNIDLRYTNLGWTRLSGSDLSGANLFGAELNGADLSGAYLRNTNLSRVMLPNANLWLADLRYAHLKGADLHNANVRDARLYSADLSNARLENADFRNAIFVGANLRHANLQHANLSGADLFGADLTGADLRYANLNTTILTEANLSQAQFGWTMLGNHDLRRVKGLDTIEHLGPSSLSVNTLSLSKGHLSEVFLRGTGAPDSFLELVHLLADRLFDPLFPSTEQNTKTSAYEGENAYVPGRKHYVADPTFSDIQQEIAEELVFVVAEKKRAKYTREKAQSEAVNYAYNYTLNHHVEVSEDWLQENANRAIDEIYPSEAEAIISHKDSSKTNDGSPKRDHIPSEQ